MAINIKFDLAGNPEPPTIILANRNGNKLGQLNVDPKSIDLADKFNDASEFSFILNKYIDNKITNLWDKVVNFKLVYCKQWDMWFEITVELDEATETVKTVTCTQLGQAELSQIMLYDIHINEEGDSNWDKENKVYKSTILYNPDDTEVSLLNRLLKDKAPHYSIAYVDPTIAKLQRTFSFDGTSIYDAFMDIAEEIGCLFVFHSNTDANGKINRKISVYDLWQNCRSCGHRSEFTDECPECGSKDIKYGYGEDTLIFVTSDELASDGIELVTDTDSVKNCFKLEAGDDLMTATVRNCNPNGTDYIWRFSEDMKEDMSKELVNKLEEYDNDYVKFRDAYESNLDENLLSDYNALVEKYEEKYNAGTSRCLDCNYKDDSFEGNCPECGSTNTLIKSKLKKITNPISGYSSLMNVYYDVVDLALFLESSMMPSVDLGSKTDAKEQAALLTTSSLSPVAVGDIKVVSKETAKSAVLSMAKILVKSTYKLEAETSGDLIDNGDGTKTWNGYFTITNYSDETDATETDIISVIVNDDTEKFIQQKVDKALNKEDSEDMSISGLFEKDYDAFCEDLKIYALNPLKSFYDACQTCLVILTDQGAGDKTKNPDLYNALYKPYFDKSAAIEAEIKIRETEVDLINGVYKKETDTNGDEISTLVKDGLKQNIEKCRNKIQDELDFEKYLGNELWIEFCSYRREDKYSNDNYVSDGLSNTELFKKAMEFYEIANNEIYKSSELQHSISTDLNNLLAIDKFKPLVNSFKLGNWIRVQVDDEVYKLRLIEYGIDFGSFDNISVDFSDVIKIKNGITDVKDILEQASSMATSYGSVQRQAKQGDEAKGTVEQWLENGLNSALIQIQSNDNEEVTFTKLGLLCRSYDDITDNYSPEQLRLTHNIMAYTDDNWETVRQAIGKHEYIFYDDNENKFVNKIGYGMNADFVTAGVVNGSQIIGGDIYSDNYSVTNRTGSYLNLRDGTFSFGGGSLRYDGGKLLISSPNIPTTEQITEINEEYLKTTSVYAQNLQVNSAKINGKLIADQIDASELKVNAANVTGTLTIGQLPSSVAETSDIPTKTSQLENNSGYQTESGVTSIVKGTITTDYVNALGIKVNAANITGTLTIGQLPSSVAETSDIPTNVGDLYNDKNYQTQSGVVNIVDGRITADYINALGITAQTLKGNTIGILNSDGVQTASINPGLSTSSGLDISSNGTLFLASRGDNLCYIILGQKDAGIEAVGDNFRGMTSTGKNTNLGVESFPWEIVYSRSGVTTTSDKNYKNSIESLSDEYSLFFDALIPRRFKYNDGTSDRYHVGFIAQEVEKAIYESGLDTKQFAGFVKGFDENKDSEICYLRYEQFTPLILGEVQKLKQEIAILKEQLK